MIILKNTVLIDQKQNKDNNKLMPFICGILCTMPIVAIPFRGGVVSLFSVAFLLQLAVLFKGNTRLVVKVNRGTRLLLFWLGFALFSVLVGCALSMVYNELSVTSAYISKIMLYIIFIILWVSSKNMKENNESLANGIIVGTIVNCLWAALDAFIWYLKGFSLNNTLFSFYIKYGGVKRISIPMSTGLYRSGGLNHDPAHLGFICPFLVYYSIKKRNLTVFLIALAGIVGSASTTGAICSLIIIVVEFFKWLKQANMNFKIGLRQTLGLCGLCVLLVIGVVYFRDTIQSSFGKATQLFYSRAMETYFSSNSTGGPRMDYLRYCPKAIIRLGIFIFSGLGFGTSVFGYMYNNEIASKIGFTQAGLYDVENTYIDYLLDTGFIGFILFFTCIIGAYRFYSMRDKKKESKQVDMICMAGIVAMLLSFLFYHYIIFAPHMLLTIVAITNMDQQKSDIKGKI